MSAYAIRYADRAAQCKAALAAPQRASLDGLEKRLSRNPFGPPAKSALDNSWTATFEGGFILYVVSNKNVVINVINLTVA